jgi:hypothetical protein
MSGYYVYGLFRPDTAKVFYIGMGSGRRAWVHQPLRRKGRSYKDNVICKYIDELGYSEIPVVIFRDDLTHQEACDLEKALIYAIGRYPHGPLTNVVSGGLGVSDPTPDTRAKMSAAKKGKPSPKKGIKYAASEKAKLSQLGKMWITNGIESHRHKVEDPIPEGWRKGRPSPSEDSKLKMAAAKKGKKQSESHKAKVVAFLKTRDSSFLHTPEIKAKAALRRKGRIWITNGIECMTILPHESEIPEGWRRGRIMQSMIK